MSSLFQGLTEPDGRVKVTTSATGAVPLRGLMVSPDGRVLIAEDTGQARVHHSGRAFDPATGALLVDPAAVTEVLGMGGMTVDINGGVITKGVAPDVIHQGVGLTNEGYLAIDRGAPEGSIFYAPLSSNLDEVVAGLSPSSDRSLEGLYEPTPNQWAIAAPGVPRFESGHFLMEPAATNKNVNYNANPDAGLTGISIQGDPAGVLRRVNDSALLAASGLANVCTDGNAIEIDATGASGTVLCDFSGLVGNTNSHSYSAFVIVNFYGGTGSFDIRSSNSEILVPFSHTDLYRRVVGVGTNTSSGARFQIAVPAGSIARFVLNGLVEELAVSTPIIVRGASASRGADLLSYPGIDSVFSQPEGMIVIDWRPKHDKTALTSSNRNLLSLTASTTNLLYVDNSRFKSYTGLDTTTALYGDFVAGELLRAVVTYGPAGPTFIVGSWHNGAWSWDVSIDNYDGSFPSNDVLNVVLNISYPWWLNNITLYDVNQGTAWVEANLTP